MWPCLTAWKKFSHMIMSKSHSLRWCTQGSLLCSDKSNFCPVTPVPSEQLWKHNRPLFGTWLNKSKIGHNSNHNKSHHLFDNLFLNKRRGNFLAKLLASAYGIARTNTWSHCLYLTCSRVSVHLSLGVVFPGTFHLCSLHFSHVSTCSTDGHKI